MSYYISIFPSQQLLFTYESKGFMTSYQPVLWGKAAIVHFGVKSQSVGFFRDPMPEQVLGLLNMDKILHTCYNFNTRLPLKVSTWLLTETMRQ